MWFHHHTRPAIFSLRGACERRELYQHCQWHSSKEWSSQHFSIRKLCRSLQLSESWTDSRTSVICYMDPRVPDWAGVPLRRYATIYWDNRSSVAIIEKSHFNSERSRFIYLDIISWWRTDKDANLPKKCKSKSRPSCRMGACTWSRVIVSWTVMMCCVDY